MTKIVCTLGPVSQTPKMIASLIDAGMNVARLNFSHGDHKTHAKNIAAIREISQKKNVNVAILQDLQGPKIRTGKLLNDGLLLETGQKIVLRFGQIQTDPNVIPIDYEHLVTDVRPGVQILLDDGLMAMCIQEIVGQDVKCLVEHGGFLKSRKGVNFPGCTLSIPATTPKDLEDLEFGCSQGVDYIALSFVQKADDIVQLKKRISDLGAPSTPIITKVEMLSAVQDIDEICEVSDGIMVARGDLGVECGFANVAAFQKRIVDAALTAGIPIIVATQLLDSMIENRRPSKAEVSDVANAVYDRADATMLSGESASGKYPILAVETMRDILNRMDASIAARPPFDPWKEELLDPKISDSFPSEEHLARVTVELADKMGAKGIVCLTISGKSAQLLAKYRPDTRIFAISPHFAVVKRLALIRGVTSIHNAAMYQTDRAFDLVSQTLLDQKILKKGDLILITGGIPIQKKQPSNTLKLHRI